MRDSRPLEDNPVGEDFRKHPDDGRRFVVVHIGVGAHKNGAVVSARDLGPGAELPRLVNLGAIREMNADEIAAHEEALTSPEGVTSVIQPTDAGPVVKPLAVPDSLKPKAPDKA